MPRHENTRRLVQFMDDNDLSISDVAKISKRTPKTIRCWRCGSSVIPDVELERLRLHVRVLKLEAELASRQNAAGRESCYA